MKYYRAIKWKIVRRNNNGYAYITVEVDPPPLISLKNKGIISIDFNSDILAVSDVDRYGNIVNNCKFLISELIVRVNKDDRVSVRL